MPRSWSSTTARPTDRRKPRGDAAIDTPLRVIEQENRGRFEARRRGLEEARGDYCLLLDSRVLIDARRAAFRRGALDRRTRRRRSGTATSRSTPSSGPYAVFWDVITSQAFWAYFANPRTTSFGLEEFERFPKGTTCFFAPRELLARGVRGLTAPATTTSVMPTTTRGHPLAGCSGSGSTSRPGSPAATRRGRRLRAVRPACVSPRHRVRRRPRAARVAHGSRSSIGLFAGISRAGWRWRRARGRPLLQPFAAASGGGVALALRRAPPGARGRGHGPGSRRSTRCAHVAGMWRGLGLLVRSRLGVAEMILAIYGTTGELIKLMPVLARLQEREYPFIQASTGQQVNQIPRLLELAGLPPVDLWLARGAVGPRPPREPRHPGLGRDRGWAIRPRPVGAPAAPPLGPRKAARPRPRRHDDHALRRHARASPRSARRSRRVGAAELRPHASLPGGAEPPRDLAPREPPLRTRSVARLEPPPRHGRRHGLEHDPRLARRWSAPTPRRRSSSRPASSGSRASTASSS